MMISLSSQNICAVIIFRRMRRAVHVERMGEMRNAYIMLIRKLEGKRELVTSCSRWNGSTLIISFHLSLSSKLSKFPHQNFVDFLSEFPAHCSFPNSLHSAFEQAALKLARKLCESTARVWNHKHFVNDLERYA
jgi:hypothetical protein